MARQTFLSPQAREVFGESQGAWAQEIERRVTEFESAAVAAEAAIQLQIPLDLRRLVHDEKHGLAWPQEICAQEALFPYPCCVAHGRFDDGVYLSIERSDAYSDFAPGFFIVIAASGAPEAPELVKTVAAARLVYADAYTKQVTSSLDACTSKSSWRAARTVAAGHGAGGW